MIVIEKGDTALFQELSRAVETAGKIEDSRPVRIIKAVHPCDNDVFRVE